VRRILEELRHRAAAGVTWFTLVAGAVAGAAIASSPAVAASLSVQVEEAGGRPVPGTVVMLYGAVRPAPPSSSPAVMDQVDLAFVPDVLVVPVGTPVTFPNSDRVSHQVYSFSDAKTFQLPLYRGRPYPPVVFDRPGLVTLGCNIHDQMLGYVLVTDAPRFGRTGADGTFGDANLPPGDYRIVVWHPRLRAGAEPVEKRVSLAPEASEQVRVTVELDLRPAARPKVARGWQEY
jgi:plastocyanin